MRSFRIRAVLSITIFITGLFSAAPGFAGVTPQTGWWWDPALSGTGWFLEYNSSANQIFMAQFLYDSSGNSTWLVSTGTYDLANSAYSNSWLKSTGGQQLIGTWKQNAVATVAPFSIKFQTDSTGVMTRPDGSQINIQRFSFTASATPAAPQSGSAQTGWWWSDPAGPYVNAQYGTGTGVGMEFQGNGVFIVAYYYDAAGNPVWYLATGTTSSPTTYTGSWDLYANGPQLNTPEGNTSAQKIGSATPMTLTFTDSAHAIMTMGSNPEIDVPLVRFFDPPSTTVTGVTVSPASAGVATGQTTKLSANAVLSDGTKIDVSKVVAWTSSTSATAAVNPLGVVTGLSGGQASITATYNNLSASSALTVTGAANVCSLANFTSATQTVTSGCTLLTRDTTSCLASRIAQGLTGAWLKFSCRLTLLKTTVNGQSVVQVSADGQPDYKSNYFGSSNVCYTQFSPSFPDPNFIAAQKFVMNVPFVPNTQSQAMNLGTVGLAVNGVALFDNQAAPGDDIYKESGSFDPCQGHPQNTGVYHYHSEPYSISVNDSSLIGVMRDGYFLYGRKDADGTTPKLDSAGGHTGTTPDSPIVAVYHYHANLQTSTTAGTVGQQVWFLTTGTYKGSPGSCSGGC